MNRLRKRGSSRPPALDSFGRDLTELARQGKLDPVLERNRELNVMFEILRCRKQRNVLLIGEVGCGKTALIEGFAQRIVQMEQPQPFAGWRAILMDLAMMLAGTKFRGQFEERFRASLFEARRSKAVFLVFENVLPSTQERLLPTQRRPDGKRHLRHVG